MAVAESEHFERWMQNSLPIVSPATPGDLRVELEAARYNPDQRQIVRIDNPMAWLMEPVRAGLLGAPLLVEVLADPGELIIADGHAIIFVNTPHQCEIRLENMASVEVIIAPHSAASIMVWGQATATVTIRTGGRGSLHLRTLTANGEIRGDTSHFWVSDVRDQIETSRSDSEGEDW